MKAFAKLSLLLALIVAGRYIRLTEPALYSNKGLAAVTPLKADTLQFATYATSQSAPAAPVSQNTSRNTPQPTVSSWY